jgi:hypothetical protein
VRIILNSDSSGGFRCGESRLPGNRQQGQAFPGGDEVGDDAGGGSGEAAALIDGPLAEQAHYDRAADTERNLATASDTDAANNDAQAELSGPDPAGNVYAHGAPSARLAGESYPEPAAAAVTRSRRPSRPRKTTPTTRECDHGRGR